jgi:HK97 gp10 family phage protein
MAIGFVQSPVTGGSRFQWLGQQVKQFVDQEIDDRLHRTGERVVARAQQLAPVDTGALRASIGYLVAGEGLRRTLVIDVGMTYGIFQEFGTRNIPPHPFIRPALLEMSRMWGIDVQMAFNSGGPRTWQGIHYAHQRKTPGYVIPSAIQPRPLNRRQRAHVANRLQPSAAALHRGNVKRAKMVVRHSY